MSKMSTFVLEQMETEQEPEQDQQPEPDYLPQVLVSADQETEPKF